MKNERENMSKIEIEKIKDMIDYHIDYSDKRNQYPNVWIIMTMFNENYSHLLEYWNQPRFLK
jgi:hypothetical protein